MMFGLIVVMLFAESVQAQGNQGSGLGTQSVWMADLNLNTQQMQQINTIRDNMQPAMMDIRHQIRQDEFALNALTRSVNPDRTEVAALEKSIEAGQVAIEALRAAYRADVRLILTSEQQMIFDASHGPDNLNGSGNKRSNYSGAGSRSGRGRDK